VPFHLAAVRSFKLT